MNQASVNQEGKTVQENRTDLGGASEVPLALLVSILLLSAGFFVNNHVLTSPKAQAQALRQALGEEAPVREIWASLWHLNPKARQGEALNCRRPLRLAPDGGTFRGGSWIYTCSLRLDEGAEDLVLTISPLFLRGFGEEVFVYGNQGIYSPALGLRLPGVRGLDGFHGDKEALTSSIEGAARGAGVYCAQVVEAYGFLDGFGNVHREALRIRLKEAGWDYREARWGESWFWELSRGNGGTKATLVAVPPKGVAGVCL